MKLTFIKLNGNKNKILHKHLFKHDLQKRLNFCLFSSSLQYQFTKAVGGNTLQFLFDLFQTI